MKKLFFLTLTAFSIMILSSCGGGSNSADQERIAQLEAQIAEMQNQNGNTTDNSQEAIDNNSSSVALTPEHRETSQEGKPGTYEFTDKINNTWVLTLNTDGTATIRQKSGSKEAYGSWEYTSYNGQTIYRFYDEAPIIYFESGEERGSRMVSIEGYIYLSTSDADAKNPRKRLNITKIK